MQIIFVVLAAAVAIWLFKQPVFWVLVAVLVAIGVIWFLVTKDEREAAERDREAELESARQRFHNVIEGHADELARARNQLIKRDRYGVEDKEPWRKELEYFLNRVLMPALEEYPDHVVAHVTETLVPHIDDMLASRADRLQSAVGYRPDITPMEYETLCADILRRAGWSARTTKGSGDQGVDVIATKGAWRLVVQCKHLARPVGNGAVQEAVAAKLHEEANVAAVVSNAGFTPSARQLAKTTGTLLMHHTELETLHQKLSQSKMG